MCKKNQSGTIHWKMKTSIVKKLLGLERLNYAQGIAKNGCAYWTHWIHMVCNLISIAIHRQSTVIWFDEGNKKPCHWQGAPLEEIPRFGENLDRPYKINNEPLKSQGLSFIKFQSKFPFLLQSTKNFGNCFSHISNQRILY